jgi:hypothetical protein
MDGVVRFVNVGRQVGVWPRTIPLGEVPGSNNPFLMADSATIDLL